MTPHKDIGEDIVEAIEGLEVEDKKVFRQVSRFPLSRLDENHFKNELVKLSLPACLVIYIDDEEDGKPKKRTCSWTLIMIFAGSELAAGDALTGASELIRTNILTQALSGKVHLRPTSKLSMLSSGPNFTAASLTMVTVDHQ